MCGSTLALAEEQQVPRLRSWAALRPSYFARDDRSVFGGRVAILRGGGVSCSLVGYIPFLAQRTREKWGTRIYSSCVLFALFGRDL
jgi:hypothetical protein